ncbi:type II toxin-antitoxin system RelE/ParE family toxin [Delftia sp. DT-2]|uniref:type II toxin-antitoxin system RelE/ParE family toxin n=1 Tax=Delftia sp. DT-2 TaxID=3022772 RepID=UPI00233ECFA3|nr:type II toxin-antitoxin system RelE/ParE family toxin [Delftia sp. DT-2]MDC2857317.1 type II toxin-antitoxin system RelE/ParE family toxin [Delftia sp. DT-2]
MFGGGKMQDEENPGSTKDISFHGNSLNVLRSLPTAAKRAIGFQLNLIQKGLEPNDWKIVHGVGPGAMELRIWANDGTYRAIYVSKLQDAVHVLHIFKKTAFATPKADIDIAAARYRKIA